MQLKIKFHRSLEAGRRAIDAGEYIWVECLAVRDSLRFGDAFESCLDAFETVVGCLLSFERWQDALGDYYVCRIVHDDSSFYAVAMIL